MILSSTFLSRYLNSKKFILTDANDGLYKLISVRVNNIEFNDGIGKIDMKPYLPHSYDLLRCICQLEDTNTISISSALTSTYKGDITLKCHKNSDGTGYTGNRAGYIGVFAIIQKNS